MDKETAKLNRLNNETDALLEGDYQSALTDIVCTLRLKNVEDYQVEVIRNDVTDLLLRAQRSSQSVEQALGGDVQTFCESVLDSAGRKPFRVVALENLQSVLCGLAVLTGFTFLANLIAKAVLHFWGGVPFDGQWDITAGNIATWLVLMAAVYGILYLALSSPSQAKTTRRRKLEAFAFGAGVMAGCLLLAWLSAAFLPSTVLRLPVIPAGVVYLILVIVFLVRHRRA